MLLGRRLCLWAEFARFERKVPGANKTGCPRFTGEGPGARPIDAFGGALPSGLGRQRAAT